MCTVDAQAFAAGSRAASALCPVRIVPPEWADHAIAWRDGFDTAARERRVVRAMLALGELAYAC